MKTTTVADVALHFGLAAPVSFSILSSGLIHNTYHVWNEENVHGIVLQQLNPVVFKEPLQIVENYNRVYHHLQQSKSLAIPAPVRTTAGTWLHVDSTARCWRANAYVPQSYTETLPLTPEKAHKAATSFAHLTLALREMPTRLLTVVLPGFHNLALRFAQFREAIKAGNSARIITAHTLIAQLLERKHYVDFYNHVVSNDQFKLRIMHHDCKLSNVLFHEQTSEAICAIDLDTLMPGYYFSDLGDMVRSMAASADETEQNVNAITIRSDVYRALLEGYCSKMEKMLTPSEKEHIHHSGLLMIYMQALRFLTDHLLGDVYYKTTYQTQNYDRAQNQLALLARLEEFLSKSFLYRTNSTKS